VSATLCVRAGPAELEIAARGEQAVRSAWKCRNPRPGARQVRQSASEKSSWFDPSTPHELTHVMTAVQRNAAGAPQQHADGRELLRDPALRQVRVCRARRPRGRGHMASGASPAQSLRGKLRILSARAGRCHVRQLPDAQHVLVVGARAGGPRAVRGLDAGVQAAAGCRCGCCRPRPRAGQRYPQRLRGSLGLARRCVACHPRARPELRLQVRCLTTACTTRFELTCYPCLRACGGK